MAGPRWVRLDVDYFRNPKVLVAGRDARDLHLASICWAGQMLTDGHIPAAAVEALARDAGIVARARPSAVDHAIDAGLWVVNGAGFVLHDFVEMNGSRSEVEAVREQWRERQRRARAKRDHRGVTP
jgi:hypothetical protein